MRCPAEGPAVPAPQAGGAVEWVQFLADLEADVWQDTGLIQSSQHTATCDVSSPPEELGSDGQNAGEILGHSERWSKNRPLVSGSIVGKSATYIRVVD